MNKKILSLLFSILGVFWTSIVAFGEGFILLIGPGASSLLIALLLLSKFSRKYIKSLCAAVGLYNLVILGYQIYTFYTLFLLSQTTYIASGIIIYSFLATIIILIIFLIYSYPAIFIENRSGLVLHGKDQ